MNRCLQLRRVSLIEANLNESCLKLKLVSPEVPNQYKLIPFLRDEISSLGIELLETVQVYAITDIASAPAWETSITLEQNWSAAQNLADAVVKTKRSICEESEDEEVVTLHESSDLVEEQTEVAQDVVLTTENLSIIEEVPEKRIQPKQKQAFSFFLIALSFVMGLSIGYFFNHSKTSLSEPTVYSTPEQ